MTTAVAAPQTAEHKAASDASKKAFTASAKNGVLTITVPVIERVSSTGKTIIIGNGKKQITFKSDKHGDQIVNVQCNAYFYNPDYVAPAK